MENWTKPAHGTFGCLISGTALSQARSKWDWLDYCDFRHTKYPQKIKGAGGLLILQPLDFKW
jgi:hypothetical protein